MSGTESGAIMHGKENFQGFNSGSRHRFWLRGEGGGMRHCESYKLNRMDCNGSLWWTGLATRVCFSRWTSGFSAANHCGIHGRSSISSRKPGVPRNTSVPLVRPPMGFGFLPDLRRGFWIQRPYPLGVPGTFRCHILRPLGGCCHSDGRVLWRGRCKGGITVDRGVEPLPHENDGRRSDSSRSPSEPPNESGIMGSCSGGVPRGRDVGRMCDRDQSWWRWGDGG